MTRRHYKKILLLAFNCAMLSGTSSLRASCIFGSSKWFKTIPQGSRLTSCSKTDSSDLEFSSGLKACASLPCDQLTLYISSLDSFLFEEKKAPQPRFLFENSGTDPPLVEFNF